MIAAALLGLTALVLTLAPALRSVRAFDRAPNVGIFAWVGVLAASLSSLVLGGLVLLVPTMPVSSGLGEFLQACAHLIHQRYDTPVGSALTGAGTTLTILLSAHLGRHLVSVTLDTHRLRRAHRDTLAVAGRRGPSETTILEHSTPAAYCLPGREGRIVLTRSALEALTAEQLDAVLAHERAHLRGRHHLLLTLAGAVAAAFPLVPAFHHARIEIARLIELAADDVAVRGRSRLALAEALLTLNGSHNPSTALAAGGTDAAARVRRLIAPCAPLRVTPALTATAMTAFVLLLPVVIAAGPAVSAIGAEHCPLDVPCHGVARAHSTLPR